MNDNNLLDVTSGIRVKRDHIDLNSCFKYKKGYKLDLKPNEYEDAERTVEFKDDCLRACLRASLSERSERGFVCRSLIFAPKQSVSLCFLFYLYTDIVLLSSYDQEMLSGLFTDCSWR